MIVDELTMGQIISNVFDEMLCMPTTPADPNGEATTDESIVAWIRITGAMEKLIIVEAPVGTATLIGETMFDAEPGSLEDYEVHDAVGEIANMIGGNVKGAFDGESTLSLPFITREGGEFKLPDGCISTSVNVAGSPLLIRWRDMSPATSAL